MKKFKKIITIMLACFIVTSFASINVTAVEDFNVSIVEEIVISDTTISPTVYCDGHVFVITRAPVPHTTNFSTHYVGNTNVVCTISTYIYSNTQICSKCGYNAGNFNSSTDSHSLIHS